MLGLANLLTKIKKRLADGHRVLIHCFGGMGRAVLVGCCLLMDLDEDIEPAEVIDQVLYPTIISEKKVYLEIFLVILIL